MHSWNNKRNPPVCISQLCMHALRPREQSQKHETFDVTSLKKRNARPKTPETRSREKEWERGRRL